MNRELIRDLVFEILSLTDYDICKAYEDPEIPEDAEPIVEQMIDCVEEFCKNL